MQRAILMPVKTLIFYSEESIATDTGVLNFSNVRIQNVVGGMSIAETRKTECVFPRRCTLPQPAKETRRAKQAQRSQTRVSYLSQFINVLITSTKQEGKVHATLHIFDLPNRPAIPPIQHLRFQRLRKRCLSFSKMKCPDLLCERDICLSTDDDDFSNQSHSDRCSACHSCVSLD
jgi:hypothetical protein